MPSTGRSLRFPRAELTAALLAILVVVGTLTLGGTGVVPTVSGQSSFTISVDGAVDVPERTVEFQGSSYQITAIAKADPGETIDVSVDAPSGEEYDLYIYNDEQRIEDNRRGTGEESFQFSLDGYTAGSYTIALQYDGSFEKVHPLVVRGYAVSVDAPAAATVDSTINVSVDASKLRGDDLERIDVAVANDDDRVSTTADHQSGSTYTANISLDGLPAGDYDVFATVRGPDDAFGEDEALGLNDGSPLTIESEDTETATPTDTATESSDGTGGGGGGGTGGVTDSDGTTTEGSTTTTQSANHTTVSTVTTSSLTPSTPGSPSPDESTSISESTTDADDGAATTEGGVITPRSTTGMNTSGDTTSSSTDGFGMLVAFLASVCTVLVWRRYQSG
ncbi:hypothetical protein [Halobellus ordinarius]|uniref:hypothetical protein n=1 Tax=Halobellus ordinarius TaxID=3075120 RepID=UPI0028802805|nr:hypothetical protein [Halobellus sp. ZY16]